MNHRKEESVWIHAVRPVLLAALGAALLPGCLLHRGRNKDVSAAAPPGAQPDKILFEKATKEIAKGRYDVGRLTLQTLINTYPDSEYLAKAKLAVADSYYKEGGVSGLTQAEAEYKDFITFFPTAPEAPEAQFRVGMAHFRLMGKADRDLSEARAAQTEFKAFLEKYPDNEVMPRVKGRLREVEEVLAEGDYETAKLYFERGANRAAVSRFQNIADNYPNYSQADKAIWYLGQSLERLHRGNEASTYYARLVTDYPLSPSVREAKNRLTAMHKPIPKPTQAMLARAQADRAASKRQKKSLVARGTGLMSGAPDLSATRHGPVRLGAHPTGEVQEAQAQAPVPGTAAIAVQTLPDSSSDAGGARSSDQPATPDAASDSGKDTDKNDADKSAASSSDPAQPSNSAAPAASATSSSTTSGSSSTPNQPDPPADKKGKLHFLKKLIPF